MSKTYYVYILASKINGTLYIGVTSNLEQRIQQHRSKTFKGFTEKYEVHNLVYYESTDSAETALSREKQLKKWNRSWKIELIEKDNPNWDDISNLDPRTSK